MSVAFSSLPAARLYAQSPERNCPFIVAGMFTAEMRSYAERLKHSLKVANLDFVVYEVPNIHCSISKQGTRDLAFTKPNFIHHLHNELHVPVLYVDVDVVFRGQPERVFELARNGLDFAVYNWLADAETDGYLPVQVNLNGKPVINRFFKFSHSVDWFDPTQLLASGCAQYYSPAARPLLHAWLDTTARFPNVVDDELLDYAYNFVVQKSWLHAAWFEKDYCRYPWWIHVKPVIDHPQLPAGKDPNRTLKGAASLDCFSEEHAKMLPPRGPFPRDCVIDVKRKCLLRPDNQGIFKAFDHISTDLWIDDLMP